MNNSRRKIGAFDFKELCKVKNLTDFGGFRIERDGVYLNKLDEATLRMLGEEEKRAVQGWHPTGRYHEPALRFPCDVDEFLSFVNESGLAGCIHGLTLNNWLQLAPPTIDTRAPDKAAPSDDDERAEATTNPTEKQILRKRAALVDEFKGMWPTIDGDLRDGSRNGLSAKANANHGYWKVGPALNWALERRRLEKPKAEEFIRAEGQSELSILVRAMLDRK